MAKSVAAKITLGILSILRVGLATAIIIINAVHLYRVTIYSWGSGSVVAYKTSCLMNGSVNNGNVCEYTYAVCGLSLLLSMIASLFLCITCDLCGVGIWLEFVVDAFQTAWWVVAAIIISDRVKETNDIDFANGGDVPAKNWRNAVAVMAWVVVLLSGLSAFVLLVEAVKRLAKCCHCCGLGKRGDDSHDGTREKKEKVQVQLETDPAANAESYTPPQNDDPVRANAV